MHDAPEVEAVTERISQNEGHMLWKGRHRCCQIIVIVIVANFKIFAMIGACE